MFYYNVNAVQEAFSLAYTSPPRNATLEILLLENFSVGLNIVPWGSPYKMFALPDGW